MIRGKPRMWFTEAEIQGGRWFSILQGWSNLQRRVRTGKCFPGCKSRKKPECRPGSNDQERETEDRKVSNHDIKYECHTFVLAPVCPEMNSKIRNIFYKN